MHLHSIIITCSPDSEPDVKQTFRWDYGDEVFSVKCAIAKLQEWVDSRDALSKATAASKSIEDGHQS